MIVLDANVIVSGLGWPESVPGRILRACTARQVVAAVPDTVRTEVVRVLVRSFQETLQDADDAFDDIAIDVVDAPLYAHRLAEALDAIIDPTDAPVVALALFLGAPVVTGDRAFHPLRRPLVQALTPRQWLDPWQPR